MQNAKLTSRRARLELARLIVCGASLAAILPMTALAQLSRPTVEPVAAGTRSDSPAPAVELENVPTPAVPEESDLALRPASFQNVVPGQSSVAKLQEVLGDPEEQLPGDEDASVWIYKIGGFRRVEVFVQDERVTSIVIHLRDLLAPAAVARELNLREFVPTTVVDESGEALGQAFPEKGILLSFAPGSESPRVAQIALEPITAEFFVHRAEERWRKHYQSGLDDLDIALQLDPNNPQAAWLEAEILIQLGHHKQALAAAADAVELEPENADYRLTHAWLLQATGRHDDAQDETKRVLATRGLPIQRRAQAEHQLGGLLAAAPNPDYKLAVQRHTRAIELAAPLAQDANEPARRAAIRLLIAAHLAVAETIAEQPWQGKQKVVDQWLENARQLADVGAGRMQIERSVLLQIHQATLAVHAALEEAWDPTATLEEGIEIGEKLWAQATDPLYKARLAWDIGQLTHQAAGMISARGDHDAALRHIRKALSLVENTSTKTPRSELLAGQLCFLAGSINAIARKDHQRAITWYSRAYPRIATPDVASQLDDGLRGEWLVSMGVSYWHAGQHDRGLGLTHSGAKLMREAVIKGELDENALAVPYINLARMHQHLGNEEEAQTMASMAAKLDFPASGEIDR